MVGRAVVELTSTLMPSSDICEMDSGWNGFRTEVHSEDLARFSPLGHDQRSVKDL